MTKKYIHHLCYVTLPDETIQITYEAPARNQPKEFLNLIGPINLQLPARRLTKAEYEKWILKLMVNGGFTIHMSRTRSSSAPSIEEVPDELPAGTAVEMQLCWHL